mgnify:CR=1 FL=1
MTDTISPKQMGKDPQRRIRQGGGYYRPDGEDSGCARTQKLPHERRVHWRSNGSPKSGLQDDL